MDDVRYRTRMSIADDFAKKARVGGNIIYYTWQGKSHGIGMAVDTYNWFNDNEDDDEDIQPPIDEEVHETTQGLVRRGASRSRSIKPEERASGSNDAVRILRRGASRSRSDETPPDVNKNLKNNTGSRYTYITIEKTY